MSDVNICDLATIYNNFYTGLPESELQSYLNGIGYEHKTPYSLEEKQQLHQDIQEIWNRIIAQKPEEKRELLIILGAPGAGKTTWLEEQIKNKPVAYICPDSVCLQMSRTFQAEKTRKIKEILEKGEPAQDSIRQLYLDCYNKWRPASNGAAHLLLAHAARQGWSICYGSAPTSETFCRICDFFKAQNYSIRFAHMTAPDKERWESITKRDQHFVQTTEKDVIKKRQGVACRLPDYLHYAKRIDFYYRNHPSKGCELAAIWQRPPSSPKPTLTILYPENYKKIQKYHNASLQQKREKWCWETLVDENANITGEEKASN